VRRNLANIDTLVAIVPRKKDWEILKNEHWYRIPIKSAPEIITQIKFLAFYQPKVFEAEKWSVNYYAEVLDLEIVKRIDLLPDESKHIRSGNKYYKITVGDLKALPNPIRSQRWRRITFIPTTFNQLFEAKEINDLYRTSPIEEKLYLSLKHEKIPVERQLFIYDTRQPCCLDFAIFCKDGNLNVECDGEEFHSTKEAQIKDRKRDNDLTSIGWSILRFSGKEINQSSKDCVRQIKRTIKLLKGFDEELKT
jgi:very-short-patch-repair endonuclease